MRSFEGEIGSTRAWPSTFGDYRTQISRPQPTQMLDRVFVWFFFLRWVTHVCAAHTLLKSQNHGAVGMQIKRRRRVGGFLLDIEFWEWNIWTRNHWVYVMI